MSVLDVLRDFLVNDLHWDPRRAPLTPDFALIDNGVVDSMGIFMLVSFLEEQFAVEVKDEEIVPENFGTLGAIAAYVERKRQSA